MIFSFLFLLKNQPPVHRRPAGLRSLEQGENRGDKRPGPWDLRRGSVRPVVAEGSQEGRQVSRPNQSDPLRLPGSGCDPVPPTVVPWVPDWWGKGLVEVQRYRTPPRWRTSGVGCLRVGSGESIRG